MVHSYYCPKCKRLRQFIAVKDFKGERCGYAAPRRPGEQVAACDGLLQKVINLDILVVRP